MPRGIFELFQDYVSLIFFIFAIFFLLLLLVRLPLNITGNTKHVTHKSLLRSEITA